MNRFLSFLFFIFTLFQGTYGQVSPSVWRPFYDRHVDKSSNSRDYEEFIVSSSHVSSLSGVSHVYLMQQVDSLLLVDGHFSLHIARNGHLLKMNDKFVRDIEKKLVNVEMVLPASAFIEKVWSKFGYQVPGWRVMSVSPFAGSKTIIRTENSFNGDVTAILRYILTEDNFVKLVWEYNFESLNGNENWLVHADANTGEILRFKNQVLSCIFGKEEESQKNKPFFPATPQVMVPEYEYRVFPLKLESPSHGPRTLEIMPADTTASPYSWHDTNGQPGPEHTTTKGNNVEAREDKDGLNNTLGEMAEGGSNLIFDFPWGPQLHPHANQNASITNLFYWNNIIHDIIYHYGFDEPSGNFQTNNYGNGGLGNDHVQADAMDGEGFNNANFFTPADGSPPRMQMFLWDGPVALNIHSPSQIEGSYPFAKASFGPERFYVTGNVVLANDGSSFPSRACNSLINGNNISGNIALVDNGGCEFSQKCRNAQMAGAIAVIVCNDVPGDPYIMPPGSFGSSINIPCVMMRKQDCDSIKVYLSTGVNLSIIVGEPVDSDYDNGIICHEYGHGISIRLTGGAAVNNCLFNEEQMGEGWSDWYGLMMTMEEDDLESRVRGIGTYVLNHPIDGTGIRTYPYSTDMGINPHTYNSIITEIVPHGVGSVWCAMLWELTWAFIREYGYDPDLYRGTGGNNKAMAIVTEALKLQPCNPGFIDGRDAILLADQVLYGGENACLIWKSFAKRGLGVYATQGVTSSRSDGNQDFEMPRSCCLSVSNTEDDGNGSLRYAIGCAMPGDTITFLNFIKDDTIRLTSSELLLSRQVTIRKPDAWNLAIESTGPFPVFQISVGATLENLRLIAGSSTTVRGIYNQGNSIFKNLDILDPLSDSGQGNTILNHGVISIESDVNVRKE